MPFNHWKYEPQRRRGRGGSPLEEGGGEVLGMFSHGQGEPPWRMPTDSSLMYVRFDYRTSIKLFSKGSIFVNPRLAADGFDCSEAHIRSRNVTKSPPISQRQPLCDLSASAVKTSLQAKSSALLLAALLSTGCYGEMNDQPRLRWLAPSSFFADGASARVPPGGTVAREQADDSRPVLTEQLVARGRERFNINCMPCHGPEAQGNGSVVQHGFPAPPSFMQERLLKAPDSHFYGAMTNGYGRMFPYADRVTPADRWAIAAYIRALQLSHDVPLESLPAELQTRARKELK